MKYVVRGYLKHKFHDDNSQDFAGKEVLIVEEVTKLGIAADVEIKCVGVGESM
jgi:hypothetical protein